LPLVKKPDDLIKTFDVNLKTQVLTRFKKSKSKSMAVIGFNQ
jgi:hypothetical protein